MSLLPSLDSGVSGLQQFQNQLDVLSNNIANVNTVGFKGARVDFADSLSQTLQASAPSSSSGGDTAAMQVGTGVSTSGIRNDFANGTLSQTNQPSDLAINGTGFFVLRDTATGSQYASRNGEFRVDDSGYLVNDSGLRVQGYTSGSEGSTPAPVAGDVQIDATGRPATADPNATMASFSVDSQGQIHVRLSDGTDYVRGQVLLQNFSDPQALQKVGGNLYTGLAAAGPLGGASSPKAAAPGSNGLGQIASGSLEMSNVDLTTQFADMITSQRSFQANARVVTTSDQILQEVVNLVR